MGGRSGSSANRLSPPQIRASGFPVISFQWAAGTDPLEAHTVEIIASDAAEQATSRSAVSRRLVALSTKLLRTSVSWPLGKLGLRTVCIDGKVSKENCASFVIILAQGRAGGGRFPWRFPPLSVTSLRSICSRLCSRAAREPT